jgi:hypothetical protein
MVYIPPDFEAPIVPELGEAERELDATILAGEHIPKKQQIKMRWLTPSKLFPKAARLDQLSYMVQVTGH